MSLSSDNGRALSAETSDPLAKVRREFLLAAIADTEGTVRATDTKASVALVLHGILFSGLLTLTKDSTAFTNDAPYACLLVILAVLIMSALVVSVLWLLRCVAPAPPRTLPSDARRAAGGLFFPVGETGWIKAVPRMSALDDAVRSYEQADETELRTELVSELYKVSAIRERKLALIKVGFLTLGIEVLGAVIYVGLLGASAASF